MADQPELPLPAPPATGDQPLVPARMVNEQVYCPRLAFLMWVEGEWGDTGDTEDGRRVHTRLDRKADALPDPEDELPPPFEVRSVTLSSEPLGVIAKFDLIEGEGRTATPVDTKRGRRPHVAAGAYDPERAQLCLQAMLLEEHGYAVEDAVIWYAASRERVRVALDDDLRACTLRAVSDLRLAAASGRRPPPLENSAEMPALRARGYLSAGRDQLLPQGSRPAPAQPRRRPGPAAACADAGGEGPEIRRVAGRRGRRHQDRGAADPCLRACRLRPRLRHHPGSARADAGRYPGQLAFHWRLAAGSYHRHRPEAPDGPRRTVPDRCG